MIGRLPFLFKFSSTKCIWLISIDDKNGKWINFVNKFNIYHLRKQWKWISGQNRALFHFILKYTVCNTRAQNHIGAKEKEREIGIPLFCASHRNYFETRKIFTHPTLKNRCFVCTKRTYEKLFLSLQSTFIRCKRNLIGTRTHSLSYSLTKRTYETICWTVNQHTHTNRGGMKRRATRKRNPCLSVKQSYFTFSKKKTIFLFIYSQSYHCFTFNNTKQ